MQNIDLKVDVVDPALFTLPYDMSFCESLSERVDVTFVSRKLKKGERLDGCKVKYFDFFYRYIPLSVVDKNKYIKGFLHCLYMFFYTIYRLFSPVDVIHFQWLPVPAIDRYFVRLLRLRNRVIFTAHNSNAFHGSASSKLQTFKWLDSLREFDAIQVHTEDSKSKLVCQGVVSNRIFVSPHGPLSSVDNILNDHCSASVGFLFFGQIKDYKDLDTALLAYKKYRTEGGRCNLTIAGQFYYRPKILKDSFFTEAQEKGVLTIIDGFISDQDLSTYLKTCSVALFPYKDIDSSGALMLAINSEVPVIVSNLPGLLGPLGDGRFSKFFNVGDSDGLAAIMLDFDKNPNDFYKRAKSAREYCLEENSWARAVDNNIEVYLGCC